MKNATKTARIRAIQGPARHVDPRHWFVGLAILIALLAYSNSLHGGFFLDNLDILNDARLRAATSDNVAAILTGPYHQSALTNLYRPLTSLSYLCDYAVLGHADHPEGYHAINLLLHSINILLVYCIGLILFESIPSALALSALWGVHPVLTEAVTNIVGRADVMAAMGVLGAVLAYHHSLRTGGMRRAALLAAAGLAAILAAFSKESGIVVFAVALLYDLLYARELPWLRRIPGLAAIAVPAAGLLVARAAVLARVPVGAFPFTENPIAGAPFVAGRITAFKVIAKSLGLLAWPSTLSPDYSYNAIAVASDWKGIASFLLCLALLGVAAASWRKGTTLAFGVLLFFVALAPVSNVFLVIGSIFGERLLYLPSVGIVVAVVAIVDRVWKAMPRRRTVMVAIFSATVCALAGRAYSRNADWADELRFWRAAAAAEPDSFKTRISLAAALPHNSPQEWLGVVHEAERSLAILDAVPIARNNAFAYRNAGTLFRTYAETFEESGDAARALQWRERALAALLKSERIERALDAETRALNAPLGLQSSPVRQSAVYRELGITYLRLKDLPNGIRALEAGRALEPEPDLLENLVVGYLMGGELQKAARAMAEELLLDSSRTYLTPKLSEVYRQLAPHGCATQGGNLDIKCPMVREDFCGAAGVLVANLRGRGRSAEAAVIRRAALADLGCPGDPFN